MSPRQMPARFLEGAPEVVRKGVLDLIAIRPAAPLDFDVVLRGCVNPDDSVIRQQWAGIDFGTYGERGCHFFLGAGELRAFRERNRRKRVRWLDLPEATRAAIVAYLEEE